jgi:large subunit ribosomal protein LP1
MAAKVQELATGYAALILTDQNLDVTADKLTAIAKAAGIALEPIWATTFERVLKGHKLDDLLASATSGGGGGGGGGGGAAAPQGGGAVAAPKEEAAPAKAAEKEASEEEEMELVSSDCVGCCWERRLTLVCVSGSVWISCSKNSQIHVRGFWVTQICWSL